MSKFPIFLIPGYEIMKSAIIFNDEIRGLNSTLFPKYSKYAISDSGLAACIDRRSKSIIYGQLNLNGFFDYIKIIPFPSIISPKSIDIVKQNIILGGENGVFCYHSYINGVRKAATTDIISYELLVSYSTINNKFNIVDFPTKSLKKSIDNILVLGNRLFAVDVHGQQKSIIEYDFSNPDFPYLIESHDITFENLNVGIDDAMINQDYIILVSFKWSLNTGDKCQLDFYRLDDFSRHKSITQTLKRDNTDDSIINDEQDWEGFLLLSNENILIIQTHKGGLGLLKITEEIFSQEKEEILDSIVYINNRDKRIINVKQIPNDDKHIILFTEDNGKFYQSIEDIDDLISNLDSDNEEYYHDDYSHESEREYERGYFDAMTDGQYGDYDDFIDKGGDIDEIDTWSRG